MCLDYITKRYPYNDMTKGVGYKAVNAFDIDFSFLFMSNDRFHEYNTWLDRDIKILYTERSQECYDSGFHIFKTRKDAENFLFLNQGLVKVEYEGIICEGEQWESNCLVVKKLKVIKEIEGEKHATKTMQ